MRIITMFVAAASQTLPTANQQLSSSSFGFLVYLVIVPNTGEAGFSFCNPEENQPESDY